ncbi:MAG: Ger(x)C family spore germination protein [Bacillota bacterium]|jgi:spore germination protein KC
MKRKLLLIILLMILTLSASSCWDIRDVNNRAFVAAIGLDVPEDPAQKYKVTFQFWDPIKIRHQSESIALTENVEAESIYQAVKLMQARIAKSITFTHLQVLFVGDELARSENFLDLANFFLKNPQVALRIRLVFIQEKTAREVLESKPKIINNVTDKVVQMSQMEREFALPRTNTFYYFLTDLKKTGGTAFGSRVILPAGFVVRHGGAVFGDYKLQGFLNAEETQAANWITGRSQGLVLGNTKDGTFTYLAKSKQLKINAIEGGKGTLKFTVNVKSEGNIVEENGYPMDLSKPENIRKMEKLFSHIIAEQIKSAVKKSQKEFGVDYLGFGQILRQTKPKVYAKINWQETFPNIPIDVSVNATVKQFGMTK